MEKDKTIAAEEGQEELAVEEIAAALQELERAALRTLIERRHERPAFRMIIFR